MAAEGDVRRENTETRAMVNEARASFNKPSWPLHIAGIIMAMCGGMINAISFLDLGEHTFVSHLTGTSTKIGLRAAGLADTPSEDQKKADAEEAASTAYAILLVVFFVCGSCLCGMIISRNAVSIGRSAYGLVLLISSFLLAVAAFSDINAGKPIGALAAAMACGIQNGMVSTYSGNIIRTTHVTGTWTDAGLSLGRVVSNLLRRLLGGGSEVTNAYLAADFARCRLMFLLALAFVLGCYFGALIHQDEGHFSRKGLLIPASILGLGGLGHAFYVSFVLNISFWQMLSNSSKNPEARQALLYIDGEVYDVTRTFSFNLHPDEQQPEGSMRVLNNGLEDGAPLEQPLDANNASSH